MTTSTSGSGIFAVTKSKAILFFSLACCWYFAGLIPQYRPTVEEHVKTRISEARKQIPSLKIDWHPHTNLSDANLDPRLNYNTSKIALLIEPRPLPHLVPQILHMITVVPQDWRFVFIGSDKSVASVSRTYAVKHQQVIGKLDLMVLPQPWEIGEKEHVWRMLTDMRFYDEFLPGVEWILKYESDSILCANSEESLNDWLVWDWAGAPRSEGDRFSGNGGLSLRRVSAIRRVLKIQERGNNSIPEDEWYGTRVWVLPGARVASGTDGQLAVEDTYIETPMGYHVRDGGNQLADTVWKNQTQRQAIFEYCPELSMIMNMKLEVERCPGDNGEGEIDPEPLPEDGVEGEEGAEGIEGGEGVEGAEMPEGEVPPEGADGESLVEGEAPVEGEEGHADGEAEIGEAEEIDGGVEAGAEAEDPAVA